MTNFLVWGLVVFGALSLVWSALIWRPVPRRPRKRVVTPPPRPPPFVGNLRVAEIVLRGSGDLDGADFVRQFADTLESGGPSCCYPRCSSPRVMAALFAALVFEATETR